MLLKDFETKFKRQVYSLTFDKSLDTAIKVCKILYFDYERFERAESWGDCAVLMDAIKFCELSRTQNTDSKMIQELLNKIDAITPDTEDFGSYLGSYALNAANAVSETLEFLLAKDPLHVYHVGSYFTDSIDFKIHESNKGNIHQIQIDQHPMMIEAINFLLDSTKRNATP